MSRHISDDDLVLYALDPSRTANAAELGGHLDTCESCRDRFAIVEAVDAALREEETWQIAVEREASGDVQRALSQLAARIQEEDAEAEELLAGFDDAPAAFAWADISRKSKYRTGGVVRRLCRMAAATRARDPLFALTLSDAAIAIAQALPDDHYPGNAVYDLLGSAWKERANALRLLGRLGPAWDAADHAERAYRRLPYPALGLATVIYVRATIRYEQQRLTEADELAAASARAFEHLGDTGRVIAAMHLRGTIRYEQHDVRGAKEVFERVLAYGNAVGDSMWIGWGSQTLGNCLLDLSDLTGASEHFQVALHTFRDLGLSAEVTRTEWGMARLVAARQPREGLARLQAVAREFTGRTMLTDAALVSLDIVDVLIAMNRHREVARIAGQAVETFAAAGMVTGALTGLAFLKEAAGAGRLSHATVAHVRRYIRAVDRQPDLLFAPPPPDPV